jgi:hypothetical protein
MSLADLTPALLARLKQKDILGGTSVYDAEQNPWQVCEVIIRYRPARLNLPESETIGWHRIGHQPLKVFNFLISVLNI